MPTIVRCLARITSCLARVSKSKTSFSISASLSSSFDRFTRFEGLLGLLGIPASDRFFDGDPGAFLACVHGFGEKKLVLLAKGDRGEEAGDCISRGKGCREVW